MSFEKFLPVSGIPLYFLADRHHRRQRGGNQLFLLPVIQFVRFNGGHQIIE